MLLMPLEKGEYSRAQAVGSRQQDAVKWPLAWREPLADGCQKGPSPLARREKFPVRRQGCLIVRLWLTSALRRWCRTRQRHPRLVFGNEYTEISRQGNRCFPDGKV